MINSSIVVGTKKHIIRGQGAELTISFLDNGCTAISRCDNDKFVVVSGSNLKYGDRVYQCASQESTLLLAKSIVEGNFCDVVAKGKTYSCLYELFMSSLNA